MFCNSLVLWWCSLLQSAWSCCSLLSVPRLSAILWILLQKFSIQTQHILPSEMRHIVVFSIISKCIATFSEESEMTEVQWNVQWWTLCFFHWQYSCLYILWLCEIRLQRSILRYKWLWLPFLTCGWAVVQAAKCSGSDLGSTEQLYRDERMFLPCSVSLPMSFFYPQLVKKPKQPSKQQEQKCC